MVSCQWSRGFEWRARALGITLRKAAELAEEGGCKLIRLAARRTAERTAIRPLAWKKDEGERLRATRARGDTYLVQKGAGERCAAVPPSELLDQQVGDGQRERLSALRKEAANVSGRQV